MARNTITQLIYKNKNTDQSKRLIEKDAQLQNLQKFLVSKITILKVDKRNLDQKISIACEKSFTEDSFVITLRAAYQVLVEKYGLLIDKERNEVLKLGGLHVIGTERHESRRIDNQLRGRAGRQGDPGSSRFFLSLEDNLLRIFGGDKIVTLMDNLRVEEDLPIESSFLNKSLESAQKKVEAYHYDSRKQLFEYDEVLDYQRQAIYSERRRILESNNLRSWILQYAESTIDDYMDYYSKLDNQSEDQQQKLLSKVQDLLGLSYPLDLKYFTTIPNSEIRIFLIQQVRVAYDLKESQIDLIQNGLMRELEQFDSSWKDHLQQMTALRETIGWRGYGQKDPLIEYKNEAYDLFTTMTMNIRHYVVYLIFRSYPILKN
jgi:preprotein translocase subunit SecA